MKEYGVKKDTHTHTRKNNQQIKSWIWFHWWKLAISLGSTVFSLMIIGLLTGFIPFKQKQFAWSCGRDDVSTNEYDQYVPCSPNATVHLPSVLQWENYSLIFIRVLSKGQRMEALVEAIRKERWHCMTSQVIGKKKQLNVCWKGWLIYIVCIMCISRQTA